MDFDNTNQPFDTPPQPPSQSAPSVMPQIIPPVIPPVKKRAGWRIFWRIILILSVIANVFMFVMVLFLAAFVAVGTQKDYFDEQTIVKGSLADKIAVIRLEGIIDSYASEDVRKQFEKAAKDTRVRAVIVRTISPGGSVSASDQIHHEILKFRKKTGKPVIAFMQTVAASGGYYTSVACEHIVAEPTVITGSIGVIMSHLVVKELFEEKLGIEPVVIKSGRRKDWPSVFSETTDEQKQYLFDKLIVPAYDRFVRLVDEGRSELDDSQVRALADGSIYAAQEALEKNLIDEIGYIDEAVAAACDIAGIENPTVVEYFRPFSLSSLLTSQSGKTLTFDESALEKLLLPRILYLWDGRHSQ